MFEWYRKAEICYAYLSDVPSADDSPTKKDSAFRNSSWFTRGWTLQELLAPRRVEFFDYKWVKIGTKSSLGGLIQSITNISHLSNFDEACVAQKMSWASKRRTSRVEDQAYCLMGLFDVKMPLLYGEGQKAFLRLQLEILSSTDDDSLFAWDDFHTASGGLLANSPTLFRYSGDIQRRHFDHERPPTTMTNQGMRIELLLTPRLVWSPHLAWILTESELEDADKNFLAPLNCIRILNAGTYQNLAISLHNSNNNQYRRVCLESLHQARLKTIKDHLVQKMIYIKQQQQPRHMVKFDTSIYSRTILIKTRALKESDFQISEKYLQSTKGARWDTEVDVGLVVRCFLLLESDQVIAAMLFSNGSSENLVVVLVISYLRGWVDFFVQKGNISLADYVQSLQSSRSLQALDSSDEKTSRTFANGTCVFLNMQKADGSLRQSYIVDINVDLEGTVSSSGRPRADTYQFF